MPRPGPTADSDGKTLRRDAARNRQRVLDAAAEAFAEVGLDVGYEEIARRAGVGVGTVYRRFPERAELVIALFESRVDVLVDVADAALEKPDGLGGLRWFLERAVEMQVEDRGLQELVAGSSFRDERLARVRRRIEPAVASLLDRAKREGSVRADVEPLDIGALMMVVSTMHTPSQPQLWRRYLELVFDALTPSPDGSRPLPLRAPTEHELEELAISMRKGESALRG
ncbi:TetR/AcrR family transcriptional regulator [Mycolicibacterium vaccae]|uniref:TetR/AcrR family transcriptional regulator n=1 Tax=Mycolicibacterium vaccae TaxID=1810 RepID=UPI003CFBEFB5